MFRFVAFYKKLGEEYELEKSLYDLYNWYIYLHKMKCFVIIYEFLN